jgi:hypothetical protein
LFSQTFKRHSLLKKGVLALRRSVAFRNACQHVHNCATIDGGFYGGGFSKRTNVSGRNEAKTAIRTFESVAIPPCESSRRWTIAWCRFSGESGSDPVQLVSQGSVDNWIMPKARVEIPLDPSPGTAKTLKDSFACGLSKQDIVPATRD